MDKAKGKEEMKLYYIVLIVAIVLIVLACIFLWEWNGFVYLVIGIWTIVAIVAKITKKRLGK